MNGGRILAPPAWVALVLLLSSFAFAQERFDHRGAVGLIAATGAAFFDQAAFSDGEAEHGLRVPAQLLLTLPIGYERDELAFGGQLGFRDGLDAALVVGVRNYFSQDRDKTYLGLFAVGHLTPFWAIGPRLALGYQHELSPLIGIFGELGLELGLGRGLRGEATFLVGVQLQSFLLE